MEPSLSKQEALRNQTKAFALRIIRLSRHLPRTGAGKATLAFRHFSRRKLSGGGRSTSKAEFISKISLVVEEADETVFWIECLIESGIVKTDLLTGLLGGK
jgi:hypothetical protein